MASRFPTSSLSNLGQRMPGVSKSSRSLLSLIHCFPLVTPGLFPVFAQAFPANELMNVDFPTFGIPTTIALTGRFLIPRFLSRSIFSRHASCTLGWIALIPCPVFALISRTWKPRSLKYVIHCLFAAGSARSDLFRRISRDLFLPSSSISGFLLESGTLASTSSITRSMRLIFSCIMRFAFVMCPGYH